MLLALTLRSAGLKLKYSVPTCFICMRIVCFVLELQLFEVPPTTRLAPSDWDHPASVLRTPGRIAVGYMHSPLDACFWRFGATLPRHFAHFLGVFASNATLRTSSLAPVHASSTLFDTIQRFLGVFAPNTTFRTSGLAPSGRTKSLEVRWN